MTGSANCVQNAVQVNSVVAAIKLTGNSKVLFNERLDSTDVTAIAEALQDDANVHTLDFSYNRYAMRSCFRRGMLLG